MPVGRPAAWRCATSRGNALVGLATRTGCGTKKQPVPSSRARSWRSGWREQGFHPAAAGGYFLLRWRAAVFDGTVNGGAGDAEEVQLLVDAVRDMPTIFHRVEVVAWFRKQYPSVRPSTVSAHITAATVNSASRHHYPGAYQHLILQRNDRALERHDPARHGTWSPLGELVAGSGVASAPAARSVAAVVVDPMIDSPPAAPSRTMPEESAVNDGGGSSDRPS
jgi:hypothetical protein